MIRVMTQQQASHDALLKTIKESKLKAVDKDELTKVVDDEFTKLYEAFQFPETVTPIVTEEKEKIAKSDDYKRICDKLPGDLLQTLDKVLRQFPNIENVETQEKVRTIHKHFGSPSLDEIVERTPFELDFIADEKELEMKELKLSDKAGYKGKYYGQVDYRMEQVFDDGFCVGVYIDGKANGYMKSYFIDDQAVGMGCYSEGVLYDGSMNGFGKVYHENGLIEEGWFVGNFLKQGKSYDADFDLELEY